MAMKRNINISIVLIPALMLLASCESFFDRYPQNKIPGEKFFSTENDLIIYSNGLTNSAIPGTGVAIGLDAYTDLCCTKLSSDKYHPGIWGPSKGGGWDYGSWSFLRQVNYMISNMPRAKANVPAERYNHYEGVARFWRAYGHMQKLKSFSNIPWIDHVLQPDDSKLYAPRDDREYVFSRILEDLTFAEKNCLDDETVMDASRISINRWVVLAYKARICLWEGTYRKYHDTNPATGDIWTNNYGQADSLISVARLAAKEIIDGNVFTLHAGNPETAYGELFTSNDVKSDEVIWARSYSEALTTSHDITGQYNSPTIGQQYSPVKEFVRMYLTRDGKCVTRDDVNVNDEFKNRDWRMYQTINAPNHEYVKLDGSKALKPTNFTHVLTGYAWTKWNQEREENYRSGALCYNALPILRYGEILLIYAESCEELGMMSPTVWEQTIGALRARAGVKSIYPLSSAEYTPDAWLYSYYTEDVNHPASLSNTMLEIRRERAIELAMESESRYYDLMRWNLGDLIERRYNHVGWRGIYVTAQEASNGFMFNGTKYTLRGSDNWTETNYPVSNSGGNMTFRLSEGNFGYLIYNYRLEWNECMYTDPIPTSALNINPKLEQNYLWDLRK